MEIHTMVQDLSCDNSDGVSDEQVFALALYGCALLSIPKDASSIGMKGSVIEWAYQQIARSVTLPGTKHHHAILSYTFPMLQSHKCLASTVIRLLGKIGGSLEGHGDAEISIQIPYIIPMTIEPVHDIMKGITPQVKESLGFGLAASVRLTEFYSCRMIFHAIVSYHLYYNV
jgi:hypothetical protein